MIPPALQKLLAIRQQVTRREDRVVFIGRTDGQFTGNVKYLFLHFLEHAPDLNPVYLTQNRDALNLLKSAGLPVRNTLSKEGARLAAEAGTVFVDDFHFKMQPAGLLVAGARIIQLWHGVGFKKIGFMEADSGMDLTPERREELRQLYSGYDVVISTSPFYTENLFQTSFQAKDIWETGYPRNDVFFRKPTKQDFIQAAPESYAAVRQLAKTKTIALYVPTFRDGGGNPLSDGACDFFRLDAFLEANDIVIVLKMHTFSGTLPDLPFKNIIAFPSHADVYPLMPLTNFMITDYSSIYTDYLVMDKPVLFFPYDWDKYTSQNRELQFDYDWITPGPKVRSQDEFMVALKLISKGGADGYEEKRREIGHLAFAQHDGLASARVLSRLRAELSP
ncbi:MAG: CDP-glycerol glycerophosphotransferase family protein [Proteobacteria bacterium]|nr:CDP-glycerol glycerophosphotransferase family protein [Pseudomonadota bacterium]